MADDITALDLASDIELNADAPHRRDIPLRGSARGGSAQGGSAPGGTAPGGSVQGGSAIPQFAINAANRQFSRVAEVLTGTAEAIDDLLASQELPLPDGIHGFAETASDTLRGLADRASEQEAGDLLAGLQRTATNQPWATASICAALGAALGLALTRLGRSPSS